jgi:DNA polymerase-3 subunit epsilon
MLPARLAIVDVETTGTSFLRDRIIEIAVLRVEDGRLTDKFHSLVNPQTSISPFIQEFTGITMTALAKAPEFGDIKDQILELFDGTTLVAHNVRFDYGFLKSELARLAIPFSAKTFCTVKLFRRLIPHLSSYSLDSLIQTFGLRVDQRHRAFDDAKVLYDFLDLVPRSFSREAVDTAINLVLKTPSLPSALDRSVIETLPQSPGVYIFYDRQGLPLYVGKSLNIKDRVLAHFIDYKSVREMKIAQTIVSIETIQTAGELGALLKEAELIKKLQPVYNRRLRQKKNFLVARRVIRDGYYQIEFSTLSAVNSRCLPDIIGIFSSRSHARKIVADLGRVHSLCPKLCGLEKTERACFSFGLGKCRGACIRKEEPVTYNLRFVSAFSKNKFQTWPFAGPIIVTENDPATALNESFLIDNWSLIGWQNGISEDGYGLTRVEPVFDPDTYKILRRLLPIKYQSGNIRTVKQPLSLIQ